MHFSDDSVGQIELEDTHFFDVSTGAELCAARLHIGMNNRNSSNEQMAKEEKFRRVLLSTLFIQAKSKYRLLLKRNEIVLLADRYHLPTKIKPKTTDETSNEKKKGNKTETEDANKSKSKSTEEPTNTLSKSTSILVNPLPTK